jgi:hypothetical protein
VPKLQDRIKPLGPYPTHSRNTPIVKQSTEQFKREVPSMANLRSVLKAPSLIKLSIKQDKEGDRKKGVAFKLDEDD